MSTTTTTNETEPRYEVGTIVECIDNVDASELFLGGLYRVTGRLGGRRDFVHVEPLDPAIGPIKQSWSYRPSRFRRASAGAKWGAQFPVPPPTTKRCLRCAHPLHWGGDQLWHDKEVARYVKEEGAIHPGVNYDGLRSADLSQCRELQSRFTPVSLEDIAIGRPAQYLRPDAQAVREAADGAKTITIPVAEYERLLADAETWRAVARTIEEVRGGK